MVLRFDTAYGREGCGWRPFKNEEGRHYDKTFATALTGEGKQANHAFGVMEIHPYPRLRRYFS